MFKQRLEQITLKLDNIHYYQLKKIPFDVHRFFLKSIRNVKNYYVLNCTCVECTSMLVKKEEDILF